MKDKASEIKKLAKNVGEMIVVGNKKVVVPNDKEQINVFLGIWMKISVHGRKRDP